MVDRTACAECIGTIICADGTKTDAITYGGYFCYHFKNGGRYCQMPISEIPESIDLLAHCQSEEFKLWQAVYETPSEEWKLPKLVRYFGNIKYYAPHILANGTPKLLYEVEDFTAAPNLEHLMNLMNILTKRNFNTVEQVAYGKGMKISMHSDIDQIQYVKDNTELLCTLCIGDSASFTMEQSVGDKTENCSLHITHKGGILNLMSGMRQTKHGKSKCSNGISQSFVLREIIDRDGTLCQYIPKGYWVPIGSIASGWNLPSLYEQPVYGSIQEHPITFKTSAELKLLNGHHQVGRGVSSKDKRVSSIIVKKNIINYLDINEQLFYGGTKMSLTTDYWLQGDNLAIVLSGIIH